MPKKNGVDVLRELSAANVLPPTLVLTTFVQVRGARSNEGDAESA
jgi:hypothetical protein